MNAVNLIGKLTRDPELKNLPTGTAVCDFTLAINKFVKGEKKGMFFDCTAFGKTAETIATYVKKGNDLGVSGSLEQQTWTTDDNQKRSKIKVSVYQTSLLSNNNANQTTNAETNNQFAHSDIPF